ncbi:hypothetical protein HK103_003590 [Boothiomyces macroporosus]|uniref:GH16 domain-containing protein n=1 Tax=Boothiomyces macroporosus TaxID=261099 RepID=A0AAD5Y3Y6_9FUNG|nr:hypothetical protein HK103_003590 [Boothiomyces macroporosus]
MLNMNVIFLLCTHVLGYTYTLQRQYSALQIANGDGFSFFSAPDPSNGQVNYVDGPTAKSLGLITYDPINAQVKIAAKHDAISGIPNSVRINSIQTFLGGLFIFDVAHLPAGCGSWPAIWMTAPPWPFKGEIDIIEGVHGTGTNVFSLHTTSGCFMNGNTCDITNNAGCQTIVQQANTFGTGFNNLGGGVVVLEWVPTSTGYIKYWQFTRNNIPNDIQIGQPTPSLWGPPIVSYKFSPTCSAGYFRDLYFIINLTFCGDYAGTTFSIYCPNLGTCNDYIKNSATSLTEAYFLINNIQVYSGNWVF